MCAPLKFKGAPPFREAAPELGSPFIEPQMPLPMPSREVLDVWEETQEELSFAGMADSKPENRPCMPKTILAEAHSQHLELSQWHGQWRDRRRLMGQQYDIWLALRTFFR